MNSVILYLVAACLAGIQAAPSLPPLPVNPGGIGGLFRGPNSETIIKGPDGSQIVSEQLGGSVETETRLQPIVVPELASDQIAVPCVSTVPVEAVNVAQGIPDANLSDPPVIPSLEIQTSIHQNVPAAVPEILPIASPKEEPHIIETELVDAPEIEPNQSSDLEGPSGSISVRGSSSIVSGPASTTISEPVKKIPIATGPIQPAIFQPQYVDAAVIAQVSAVAAPEPVDRILQPLSSTPLQTNLVASAPADTPLLTLEGIGIKDTVLRTDLFPPPVSPPLSTPLTLYNDNIATNSGSEIPLISLTGTAGAGIADATLRTDLRPPHITIISSTQAPPVSLSTQKSIDLGQTVTSSTVIPVSASSADIDESRINLGRSNYQAVGISNVPSNWAIPNSVSSADIDDRRINLGQSNSPAVGISNVASNWAIPNSVSSADIEDSRINLGQSNSQAVGISNVASNWAIPSSSGQNIVYSDAAPISSPSYQIHTSDGRPSRPLLTTAAELQRIQSSGLANPNIILQSDAVNGGSALQNQAVLTNQIVSSTPRYIDSDGSDLINNQRQVDLSLTNIQSRPWLNVQPTQSAPSTVSPAITSENHETPIASILDSVFVQPTDPRNREIIEFGGKQLENVGNIVPVIQHPVLLTGNLNNVQRIPTVSISQLSSRNELDPSISNRYGRNAPKTN